MLAAPGFSMLHTNLDRFSVIREKEDAHLDIHLCGLQLTPCRISVGKLQGHYQRYRTPHFLLNVLKGNQNKKMFICRQVRFILRDWLTSLLGLPVLQSKLPQAGDLEKN